MSDKRKKNSTGVLPVFSTPEELESLSAADQAKVDKFYSRKIPRSEMRPLTAAERARFDRAVGRKPGRPKIGQGAKVVAVTLEKGFLKQVDAYAKKQGLKRAEMINKGLRLVMSQETTETTETRIPNTRIPE
jgi:hypothetical protein